jgi:predicted nucleotidyltransferase
MIWSEKYVGLKVLGYFLTHPSEEIHLKELGRVLEISPGSAKKYCDDLAAFGLIQESALGNLRLLRLNRDDFAVRGMMTACHLFLFKELGIENLAEGCISFAIYGSFASGNFDERSDLDLLVIGEETDVKRDRVLAFQEKLGRSVQLTVLPYYRWEALKKEGDGFAESVLRDHVLVKGVEL